MSGTYIALLLCVAKSKGHYFGHLYSPQHGGLLILLANYVVTWVGNLTHFFRKCQNPHHPLPLPLQFRVGAILENARNWELVPVPRKKVMPRTQQNQNHSVFVCPSAIDLQTNCHKNFQFPQEYSTSPTQLMFSLFFFTQHGRRDVGV